MQLFLHSVMQLGENFQSSPRGSIINIRLVCCHTVFPGSISVLCSKWNPFLRGGKARLCLFYAKSHIFLLHKNSHWNRMGSFLKFFFLVLLDIWSSAFLGQGHSEVDFTLWPWCQFLPQSSSPEWKAIIFQGHKGIPSPFFFSKPLYFLTTHSHITTQQPFVEDTCFLYSQLNIFTQIWGLLCPSGPTRTCAEFSVGENNLEMGNGLFGSVSTSQGFSSQESCAQTLCPLFSPSLL